MPDTPQSATKYAWAEMPVEQLNDQLSRRLITGDKLTSGSGGGKGKLSDLSALQGIQPGVNL